MPIQKLPRWNPTSFLKSGKAHRYGRAFAEFAYHLHPPAVQVGAAFHEQQTKSRPRTGPYIAAAMKGLKKLVLIFLRNADPLVSNYAHCIEPLALNHEMHCRSRLRIFHSVTQEIGEYVAEKPFIRPRFRGNGVQREFDSAAAAGRRENLIHDAAAKVVQVERCGLKVQFARIQAAAR